MGLDNRPSIFIELEPGYEGDDVDVGKNVKFRLAGPEIQEALKDHKFYINFIITESDTEPSNEDDQVRVYQSA
jgi:hypothetical protein